MLLLVMDWFSCYTNYQTKLALCQNSLCCVVVKLLIQGNEWLDSHAIIGPLGCWELGVYV